MQHDIFNRKIDLSNSFTKKINESEEYIASRVANEVTAFAIVYTTMILLNSNNT